MTAANPELTVVIQLPLFESASGFLEIETWLEANEILAEITPADGVMETVAEGISLSTSLTNTLTKQNVGAANVAVQAWKAAKIGFVFTFTNANDAMLFKLRWG